MRHSAPCTALALVAALLGGCETSQIQAPPTDSGSPTDSDPRDTADADTAPVDTSGPQLCDARAADPGCPAGMFCETTAFTCVDCIGHEERCTADGVREVCEKPESTGIGNLTGGFFVPAPCDGTDVCVDTGVIARCDPLVCEPGLEVCADSRVRRCNALGTASVIEKCEPGRACYEGACEIIRHNVLVVFDTSGSMHDYIAHPGSSVQCVANDNPCLDDYPACDDPADPLTMFTLAKTSFSDSVRAAIGGFAQFALQRFPQIERGSSAANCFLGWYQAHSTMTGDDDARETVSGGWFDDNYREAIIVGFPPRDNVDNTEELLGWLDFRERLSPSTTACELNSDCGTGRCAISDGAKRCFYHSEDELRAGGETPLGKSLFYAGEYLRRFVVVDGKPCERNVDCGSAGYVCVDDACVDPYRKCRDNFVILFTDGKESEHRSEDLFFNPVVQAQRLAFGLDCETDADCRGNATCVEANPDCAPKLPGTPNAQVCRGPQQDDCDIPIYADSGGFSALSAPNGDGLSIRTTVMTLQYRGAGDNSNPRIAAAGGGAHLDLTVDDPIALKQQLIEAMSPNFKCAPEDLEDL